MSLSMHIHVSSTLFRLWKSCALNKASDLFDQENHERNTGKTWRLTSNILYDLCIAVAPRISSCSPSSECAHHHRLHIFRQDPAEIDEMLQVTWANLPQVGMKIKHIWNRYLDVHWFTVDSIKGQYRVPFIKSKIKRSFTHFVNPGLKSLQVLSI